MSTTCCTTTTTSTPSCNCPPTPGAPWSRTIQGTVTQELTGAGTISIAQGFTILNGTSDVAITIPDGTRKGQSVQIFVAKAQVDAATSGTFTLTGTLVGMTGLTFDSYATNAILTWDGAGWHMSAGNASPVLS